MHTPETDWWKSFFHGIALDLWRAAVTDEQTKNEADVIQKLLALPGGASILDVPCGNGRHCLELAGRGYAMTGLDIAVSFIEEARAKAAQRGLAVTLHAGDMRHLPWREEFDGAFCFGNSFGYMSDADNAAFLKSVAEVLKPGGRFVLQSPMVAEAYLPQFKEHMSYEVGGIKFEVAHQYNLAQSRLETEYTFTRDGKTEKRVGSHRVYTYRELCGLVGEARFDAFDAYGANDREPFRLGSPILSLVATKLRT